MNRMVDHMEACLAHTYEVKLRELRAQRRKATGAERTRIDKSIREFERRLGSGPSRGRR